MAIICSWSIPTQAKDSQVGFSFILNFLCNQVSVPCLIFCHPLMCWALDVRPGNAWPAGLLFTHRHIGRALAVSLEGCPVSGTGWLVTPHSRSSHFLRIQPLGSAYLQWLQTLHSVSQRRLARNCIIDSIRTPGAQGVSSGMSCTFCGHCESDSNFLTSLILPTGIHPAPDTWWLDAKKQATTWIRNSCARDWHMKIQSDKCDGCHCQCVFAKLLAYAAGV